MDALLAGPATPSGSREVRTFMFTDIVGSTALVEAIGDEAWHDLLHWHDEALAPLLRGATRARRSTAPVTASSWRSRTRARRSPARSRSSGRSPITAGTTGSRPRSGSACTAPRRRAWADDYEGAGVHAAARIGALAEGGEVLASVETVEGIGDVATESLVRSR